MPIINSQDDMKVRVRTDSYDNRIRVKSDPIVTTGSTSGSTTYAVSLGGEPIYKQKVGNILQFKGLVAGAGISLVGSATGVTITSTVTGGTGGVPVSQFNTYTGATETRLDNIEDDITYISGVTDSKLPTSRFNTYTGATQTALDGKVDESNFNTYTGNTATALSNINSELDLAVTGVTVGTNLAVNNSNPRKPHITFTGSTSGGGSITGGTSLGGEPIYKQVNGANLEFKGLVAGTNISLVPSATGVTINNTQSLSGLVTQSNFNTYTGATETRLDDIEADITYISGVTDSKLPTSRFNTYTGATQTVLDSKVDESNFNTFTGTTLPATYKKISEFNAYTGATQTALDGKVDESNFNTYTGATATALSNINSELDLAVTGGTSGSGIAVSKVGRNLLVEFTGSTSGGGFDPSGTTVVPLGRSLSGNRQITYSLFANDADEADVYGSAGIARNSGANGSFNYYNNGTNGWYWMYKGHFLTGGTAALELSQSGLMKLSHPYGGSNSFTIASGSGSTLADIIYQKGNNARWIWRMDSSTESGSNAGSNLALLARADDGGANLTPLSIQRSTGRVQIRNGANIYGDIKSVTGATTLAQDDGGMIIECSGTFTLTLPNGMDTGLKYTIVNVGTGIITIAASGTMKSLDSRTKLRFQYAGATAYHRGSNDWMVIGNLQD